jgi:hypothetical protein
MLPDMKLDSDKDYLFFGKNKSNPSDVAAVQYRLRFRAVLILSNALQTLVILFVMWGYVP